MRRDSRIEAYIPTYANGVDTDNTYSRRREQEVLAKLFLIMKNDNKLIWSAECRLREVDKCCIRDLKETDFENTKCHPHDTYTDNL